MNNTEIETQSNSYTESEVLSESELLKLNYNNEISKNFDTQKENIKLKLEILKSHLLLLESKKETIEREKVILEYNLHQNTIEHQEFKIKQKSLLDQISKNHPTMTGKWNFDKHNGKMIDNS